jgi:hypothetical protein
LKILLRLGNVNSIVLGKALEEMHPLMDQPIPGFSLLVVKRSIPISTPLAIKCRAAIVAAEIRPQAFSKQRPKIMAARVSFSRRPSR